MKNEYIEVVKRWQAGEVFSVEALRANAEAAEAAAEAADDWAFVVRHDHSNRVAHAAKDDAHALWAANDAARAEHFIQRYEEILADIHFVPVD
tara:strand:- start:442 stop:720 length:279 start_codon:yes stop_codon:yes gene_type:complete